VEVKELQKQLDAYISDNAKLKQQLDKSNGKAEVLAEDRRSAQVALSLVNEEMLQLKRRWDMVTEDDCPCVPLSILNKELQEKRRLLAKTCGWPTTRTRILIWWHHSILIHQT
jgi:hypothetical protein